MQLQTLRTKSVAENGPTAALWIQYFYMISLVKNLLQQNGHNLYAKSAHLYLQDMREIKNKMNTFEYEKFANDGFFTIRRSDIFWSGIWSDMTIE